MIAALLIVVALALAVGLGRWRAARLEGAIAARFPLGPRGVVAGAEPIDLAPPSSLPPADTGAHTVPAVLLLHGGGDTPQALGYLAAHLHGLGYAVRAPLLPGHGRSVRDFTRVHAEQWADAARAEYRALRARHDWVALVGLSMGGALAVRLAAATADVPALVLVAPYLAMPPRVARAARGAWLWGLAVPYVRSASGRSIHDPAEAERSLAYGVFTPAALRALLTTVQRAAAALPHVTAPTLVVQSRDDNRIAPAAAEQSFARLGAADKRLVWLEGTGHVLTVDYGRDKVFTLVARWLAAHRPGAMTDEAGT